MDITVLVGSTTSHPNPCRQPPEPPEPPIVSGTFTGWIPIDLLNFEIDPDEIDTNYYACRVQINPDWFDNKIDDGYFEASFVRSTDVTDTHEMKLVDENGTEYSSLFFAPPVTDFFGSREEQGEPLTTPIPNDTTHYYFPKVMTCDSPGCHFKQARLWIHVTEATKIAIQIPLLTGDEISGFTGTEADNNIFSASNLVATTSATYGYGTNGSRYHALFQKRDSKWGTIDYLRFVGTGGSGSASELGDIAFFNHTDDVMVTGTNLNYTEQNPTTKEVIFANNAANFDDLDVFEARLRRTDGGPPLSTKFFTTRVDLWYHLIAPIKCEIHIKCGSSSEDEQFDSAQIYRTRYISHPNATAVNFEATVFGTGAGNVYLDDLGTSDSDYAGTPASTIDVTAIATRTLVSQSVTLTENNRYAIRHSTFDANSAKGSIVLEIPEQV